MTRVAPLRNLATASLWAFEHALLDADVMQLQQALQDEFYNFATTPPGWQDAWKATAVVTACEAWRASANQQAQVQRRPGRGGGCGGGGGGSRRGTGGESTGPSWGLGTTPSGGACARGRYTG